MTSDPSSGVIPFLLIALSVLCGQAAWVPDSAEKRALYRHAIQTKLRLFARRPGSVWFYLRYYGSALRHRRPHATVVSFPKSGRTWLEHLLIAAWCAEHGLDHEAHSSLTTLAGARPAPPRIAFTHAGSSWETAIYDAKSIARVPLDRHARGRVIFLHRDPRDVLVSCYHHIRYRTGVTGVAPARLVDSPVIGVDKLIVFMNRWREYVLARPDAAIMLSYEDLRADTAAALTRIAAFLGLGVSAPARATAIAACAFDAMQRREQTAALDSPWFGRHGADDVRGLKVRSGKIGQYRALFSPEECARLDARIAEGLDPAFGYAAPPAAPPVAPPVASDTEIDGDGDQGRDTAS